MQKPRLFIGSSVENLDVAYAAQEHLEQQAEVTVWDQGIFGPSQYPLEALLDALDTCDYGLFIFAPDDIARIRGTKHRTVRDNLVFELGLFIGRIGRKRSFIIIPKQHEDFHLPSDLLGLTPASYDPERADENLRAALGPACQKVKSVLKRLGGKSSPIAAQQPPKLVPRTEFTEFLLAALSSDSVSRVMMITYTAEVDSGLLDKYHVTSGKRIEIYKRSVLTDLAEQQEWNMRRLAAGVEKGRWDKRGRSIAACERIVTGAPEGTEMVQYLYTSPPTLRAYVLDSDEAVFGFYQVIETQLEEKGSVYRGMNDKLAVKVSSTEDFGQVILEGISEHAAGLRRVSRTWSEERRILFEGAPWTGPGRRPCISPMCVFLDVDGVLLDSLPLYVKAWRQAFALIGEDFPEERVYLEEGRRGSDTIRRWFHDQGRPDPSDEVVRTIQDKKRDVLAREGPAPIQNGSRGLLRNMAECGLDIWAVTGSSDGQIRARLSADFEGLIHRDRIVTGDETRAGKPDPGPFLLACQRANVHPHHGIAVENAPLGVRAADSAGLFCLGVSTGPLPRDLLQSAGARAVFDSCETLAERWQTVLTILTE